MQSRDGLVSSPRRNPALQSFLCTRGFPTPASLSFQSWFPLIDVQRPGQSAGPLPGWGPPPGSCPAPRLAHLFRNVIGIIGLWRTQGCHLPLGSIWNTGKSGQHGPCALIARARDLRGESWEQSGRRADRCHCGDLEGGLRVTTGQRGECWIVSSLLSLVGKAHGGNNQREAQPSSPPWCPLSTVSPWVTQPVLCPLPTDSPPLSAKGRGWPPPCSPLSLGTPLSVRLASLLPAQSALCPWESQHCFLFKSI